MINWSDVCGFNVVTTLDPEGHRILVWYHDLLTGAQGQFAMFPWDLTDRTVRCLLLQVREAEQAQSLSLCVLDIAESCQIL